MDNRDFYCHSEVSGLLAGQTTKFPKKLMILWLLSMVPEDKYPSNWDH